MYNLTDTDYDFNPHLSTPKTVSSLGFLFFSFLILPSYTQATIVFLVLNGKLLQLLYAFSANEST